MDEKDNNETEVKSEAVEVEKPEEAASGEAPVEESEENAEKSKDAGNYMAEGMCIGLALGTALGLTVFDNIAIGTDRKSVV